MTQDLGDNHFIWKGILMSFRFEKQTHRSSLIPCLLSSLIFYSAPPHHNPVFQLHLIHLYSPGVLCSLLVCCPCSLCLEPTFLPPSPSFPSLLPSGHFSLVRLAATKCWRWGILLFFYIVSPCAVSGTVCALVKWLLNELVLTLYLL